MHTREPFQFGIRCGTAEYGVFGLKCLRKAAYS